MTLKLVLIALNFSYLLNSIFGYVVPVPPPTQHIEVHSATANSIKAFTDANYLMGSDRKTLYDVLYGSNANTKSTSSSLISYDNINDWELEKPLDSASPFFAKFLQGWEAIAFATGVPVTYFMGQQFQRANDRMLEKERKSQMQEMELQQSIAAQKVDAERKAREREKTRQELEAKIKAAKAEEERIRRNNAEARKQREEKIKQDQARNTAAAEQKRSVFAGSRSMGASGGSSSAGMPTPPDPRKDNRNERERKMEEQRRMKARGPPPTNRRSTISPSSSTSSPNVSTSFVKPVSTSTASPLTQPVRTSPTTNPTMGGSGRSRFSDDRREEAQRRARAGSSSSVGGTTAPSGVGSSFTSSARSTPSVPSGVSTSFVQPARTVAPAASTMSRPTMGGSGRSRFSDDRRDDEQRKGKAQQVASSNRGTGFGESMKATAPSIGNSFTASSPAPVPKLTTFPVPPKINNSNMQSQGNSAPAPVSPPSVSASPSNSYTKPQNPQPDQTKRTEENKKGGDSKIESAKITTFPIPPNIKEEVRKVPELRKGPVDPQKLLTDALNTMTVRQLKAYIRVNDKKTKLKLKATARKKEYVNAALDIAKERGLDDSLAELQNKVKL